MHGAALPLGATCSLAVKLGDHFFEITTLCQIIGVAPVSAKNHILRPQGFANSNGDRFLADGKMHRTLDLVAGIDSGDLLLYPSNPVYRSVKPLVCFFNQLLFLHPRTSNRFFPNRPVKKLWAAIPSP